MDIPRFYTREEAAAKAWAKEHGWYGRSGGWIYRPDGSVFSQGWWTLASSLRRRGELHEIPGRGWFLGSEEDAANHRSMAQFDLAILSKGKYVWVHTTSPEGETSTTEGTSLGVKIRDGRHVLAVVTNDWTRKEVEIDPETIRLIQVPHPDYPTLRKEFMLRRLRATKPSA